MFMSLCDVLSIVQLEDTEQRLRFMKFCKDHGTVWTLVSLLVFFLLFF